MLPYFPFGDRFNDKMGTTPLGDGEGRVEVDWSYADDIALKRALLVETPNYYFQAQSNTEAAQWEVLELLLNNLCRANSGRFFLEKTGDHWRWRSGLLNEETAFMFGRSETLPLAPLDWVGRQVQEDLLLLDGSPPALVAGQLCFANDWSLGEKLGLPFAAIHAPVGDSVAPMLRAAETLLERLPANRPVARFNWSFKLSDELDQSARHAPRLKAELARVAPELTPESTGDRLFVRVERQTLSRLSRSGAVLFTVRTFQNRLAAEAADPARAARMLDVLRTAPGGLLDYKSITPFLEPLLAYLERRAAPYNQP